MGRFAVFLARTTSYSSSDALNGATVGIRALRWQDRTLTHFWNFTCEMHLAERIKYSMTGSFRRYVVSFDSHWFNFIWGHCKTRGLPNSYC